MFEEHGICSARVFGCSRKCARENGEKESSLQTRNNEQVDSAFSNIGIRELWVEFEQARICCSSASTYTTSRQPQGLSQHPQVPMASGCRPPPPLSPQPRRCRSCCEIAWLPLWTSAYRPAINALGQLHGHLKQLSSGLCLAWKKMFLYCFLVFILLFLLSLKLKHKINLEMQTSVVSEDTFVTLALSTTTGNVAKGIKKYKQNESRTEYRSEGLTSPYIIPEDPRIYSWFNLFFFQN